MTAWGLHSFSTCSKSIKTQKTQTLLLTENCHTVTRYKCSLPLIYNNSILWTKTAGTLCLFTGIDVFSVCLSLISRKFLPTLNFFVLNQKKKNYALETFTATNKTKPYFLSVYTVESQETGPLVSKNVHHQSACVSLQDSPTLSWHCNYYKVEVTWLFQA